MKLLSKFAVLVAVMTVSSIPAFAQDARKTGQGAIEPISGFTGKMSMTMETAVPDDMAVTDTIRFEPWQILDELFRDDLVFIMRSGPTDWTMQESSAAEPLDCENQRLLTVDGSDRMRQLGALLVANGLRPGHILVSEWCRAQQSFIAMERGMVEVDRDALKGLGAMPERSLNLLGAEQGTADVAAFREIIATWDGGDGDGPLLLITHFPNIAALTNFHVYEGEMLIVDPKRGNRVLGYLRLATATPDVVRFDPSVVVKEAD